MNSTTQAALIVEDLLTTFFSGALGNLFPTFPYKKMIEANEQTSNTYLDYIERIVCYGIVY